jgi:hypothetical protein
MNLARPKPACLPIFETRHDAVEEKQYEPLNRFVASQQVNDKAFVTVSPPSNPPTYRDYAFEKPLMNTNADSQLSLFEAKKPMIIVAGMKRSGSQESGFYTADDVASNASFSA